MTDPAHPRILYWTLPTVVAVLFSLIGIGVYAAFAAGVFAPDGITLFGTYIYNYYFLAIADGRLDIPLRVISLEGHYDAAGRAFVYHGAAPLLTRALAAPFVDLREVSLTAPSIWLYACLGSMIIYHTVLMTARQFGPQGVQMQTMLAGALGLAVWLCGPGLILSANTTLYNEAIAVGFFCAAVWLAAAMRLAVFGVSPKWPLIAMALAAGFSVHARVPLAVGLYAGTCLMLGLHVLRARQAGFTLAIGILAILFVFGLGFLGMNALRFGSPFQVSGSNVEGKNSVVYGFVYWGVNPPGAHQLDAFLRDGTFSLKRFAPNLFLYLFDVPKTWLSDIMLETYRTWTVERGHIRVETPRVGMIWLWAPWFMVIWLGLVASLGAVRRHVPLTFGTAALPLLTGTAIAAGLILCYGTMTLRYRVDLWPFLAAAALLALVPLLAKWRDNSGPRLPDLTLISGALALGIGLSGATAVSYSKKSAESGIFSFWGRATCETMVLEKGFSPSEIDRLCRL